MNALKEDRERLEQDKANAEATVGEDAMILTDPKSVSDHATQLREFLETVEPSEWKPIIRTFVKNVSIGYNEGVITYKIPLPDDDPFARRMTSTIDLSGKVPSSVNSAPGMAGLLQLLQRLSDLACRRLSCSRSRRYSMRSGVWFLCRSYSSLSCLLASTSAGFGSVRCLGFPGVVAFGSSCPCLSGSGCLPPADAECYLA